MTMFKSLTDALDRVTGTIRAATAEQRAAEADRRTDTRAARALDKKNAARKELRAIHVQDREGKHAEQLQIVARFADEQAVLADQEADLVTQLAAIRHRKDVAERNRAAAQQTADRLALNPARAYTLRLGPQADRDIPPQEIATIDGAGYTALVIEGIRLGAWSVDFVFNEATGLIVGTPKYHRELSPEERRAAQREVDGQIAARRGRMNLDRVFTSDADERARQRS